MAQKTNHRCIICGKLYYHCNDCDRMKTFTPWRRVACSSECYQTYLAWRMYQDGEMTAEEMKEVLVEHGFDKKSVVPELREHVAKILGKTRKKNTDTPNPTKEAE